jgi:replicative DNA helicase
MGAAECAGRLLSHDSGVARPRKQGDLSPDDRKKLENTKNRMKSWPITFKDDSSATVDSFRAFLAQEVIQGRVGLAVIDYLQLLSAPGHDSRVQEVSYISRVLKQTAMELGVPILALSQLNRALETQNRKPVISDLRESGSIEQDADCVFLLSRSDDGTDYDKREIHFNVAKNRNGESMATNFDFHPSIGRFTLAVSPTLNDGKVSQSPW